jgi:hypothetical protein
MSKPSSIHFTVTLTATDWQQILERQLKRNSSRNQKLFFGFLFVVSVLRVSMDVWSFFMLPGEDWVQDLPLKVISLVLLGMSSSWLFFQKIWAWVYTKLTFKADNPLLTTEYWVSSAGLKTKNFVGISQLDWKAFQPAEIDTNLLVLPFTAQTAIYIPKRALTSSQWQELQDLVAEQVAGSFSSQT